MFTGFKREKRIFCMCTSTFYAEYRIKGHAAWLSHYMRTYSRNFCMDQEYDNANDAYLAAHEEEGQT
jgi:hypothetical protein